MNVRLWQLAHRDTSKRPRRRWPGEAAIVLPLIVETSRNSGPAVTEEKHIRYSPATIELAGGLNFEESQQRGRSENSLRVAPGGADGLFTS